MELDRVGEDLPIPRDGSLRGRERRKRDGVTQGQVRRTARIRVQRGGDIRRADVRIIGAGIDVAVLIGAGRWRRLPGQVVHDRVVVVARDGRGVREADVEGGIVVPIHPRPTTGDRAGLDPQATQAQAQGAAVRDIHRERCAGDAEVRRIEAAARQAGTHGQPRGVRRIEVVAAVIVRDQAGGRDHDMRRRGRVRQGQIPHDRA